MSQGWQILALRYAENTNRTRADSFVDATDPNAPHPMDFYFWVLRRGGEVIVVDTGMDGAEGTRRGRPILREPMSMLADLGIDPVSVGTVVITHLHFDHAGCLDAFPNALFHLQAKELAFAQGPGLSDPAYSFPYSPAHVVRMAELVRDGRAILHDGEVAVTDGVTGHLVGGHAAGLMALTVSVGPVTKVLASDVAHYYESITHRPIFHIVVDKAQMQHGYAWTRAQCDHRLEQVIPAHDPALRAFYPEIAPDVFDVSGPPGRLFATLPAPKDWR